MTASKGNIDFGNNNPSTFSPQFNADGGNVALTSSLGTVNLGPNVAITASTANKLNGNISARADAFPFANPRIGRPNRLKSKFAY